MSTLTTPEQFRFTARYHEGLRIPGVRGKFSRMANIAFGCACRSYF